MHKIQRKTLTLCLQYIAQQEFLGLGIVTRLMREADNLSALCAPGIVEIKVYHLCNRLSEWQGNVNGYTQ